MARRVFVRYARVVILEHIADVPENLIDADGVFQGGEDDLNLPGVFAGVPGDRVPDGVQDIQDYEHIWGTIIIPQTVAAEDEWEYINNLTGPKAAVLAE